MTRRNGLLAGLVLVFVLAAGVGAYLDWMWWEVYSGLLITIAAGLILLVAIALAVPRRSRPVAVALAAVGVGLLAGQNLGPSRPPLRYGEGTMTVTLSAPRSTTGSIESICATDDSVSELLVSGDPNLRLDIIPDDPNAPPDVDQREHVGVSLTVGDRWRESLRPDTRALELSVGRVEADAPESRMMAGPSSTLEIEWSARGGRAEFSGLLADTRFEPRTGEFIDVAGTIEWTCEPREANREG